MSLVASEDHRRFRERARRVIEEHILPFLAEWEEAQTLPRHLFETWGEAGFAGLLAPREWGGAELDFSYSVILAEELLHSMAASIGISLLMPSNAICPLLTRYASDELRRLFLRPLAEGQLIASLGVTEPGGGSDLLGALRCTAVSDGDDWRISGEKIFITNAPIADVVFVLARTSKAGGALSMSLIAVPTRTPGFKLLQQHDKLGIHASPTGWFLLDGCRVPKSYLLGQMNHGYLYFSEAIAEERLLIAVGAVAYARSCLEKAVEHLKTRRADGTSPSHLAAWREELGAMLAELEAARAYVYATAETIRHRKLDAARTYIAKYAVCETAQRITRRCIELHGSSRLREGTWMARALCDIRVLTVFAGTSETMRDLVSASLVRRMRLAASRQQREHRHERSD